MKVYQAPDKIDWYEVGRGKSIFLAGGITGCDNWQEDLIFDLRSLDNSGLFDLKRLTVFNPRRDDFDVTDTKTAIEQIKWEHKCLEMCDICSFFFPASESVQPITLYELGKYSRDHTSVISIQEGYKRAEDVKIQLALDGNCCSIYSFYDEAIREHARALAITYDNMRRNRV
jgi:hypothetical protein